MDTLERRLQLLEREVQHSRRVNRILIFATVVIACVAGAQSRTPFEPNPAPQQQAQQPGGGRADVDHAPRPDALRTIEAGRFVLLDGLGRSRATMTVAQGGPAIRMFDEKGKKRVELSQTDSAVGLCLLDPDESPVVSLQLPHNTEPGYLEFRSAQGSSLTTASGIFVKDTADHGRLHLALLNGNFPMLGISQSGQNGPPSIEMTATTSSRSLKLHDINGHPLFTVFSSDRSATSLSMTHPDHQRSLQISTGPKDADNPTIAFFAPARADGTGGLLPRLRLGLRGDNQPYIRTVNDEGRATFTAP